MAELSDSLTQLLDDRADQIGQRIGADGTTTRSAMHAAIPALLAALSADANRGTGLRQALEQDHDGAILDQLSDYLGGSARLSPRTTNGAGILEHVLGGRRGTLEQALSAKSGLSLDSIAQLLPLLAPILMGMLGKRGRTSGGGGGISLDDIGDLLNREKADAHSRNPDIGDILDSFGDADDRPNASRPKADTRSGGGLGGLLDAILGRKRGG
jgi:hypothetical protein